MLGAWWGTEQLELPFPTATMGGQRYKVYGVVTNRQDMPGPELIHWHRERCGRSEHAHAIMKSDLAGGKLPSALFGANAAWWAIMILALNLDAALKALVLGPAWRSRRLKASWWGIDASIRFCSRWIFVSQSKSCLVPGTQRRRKGERRC